MNFADMSDALERVSELKKEVITDPMRIADFGAVKPKEYGSLIRQKLAEKHESVDTDVMRRGTLSCEIGCSGLDGLASSADDTDGRTRLDYSADEIAGETADRLIDHGISAKNWKTASPEDRIHMIKKAIGIMRKALQLREDLLIPSDVDPNSYAIGLSVRPVSFSAVFRNGYAVEENGCAKYRVSAALHRSDYASAMSDMYFNMAMIKQFEDQGQSSGYYRSAEPLIGLTNERGDFLCIMNEERLSSCYTQAVLMDSYFQTALASSNGS